MRASVGTLALILASGCSALLPGPSDEVRCAVRADGSDPCVELGRVCAPDGICRGREVCNALDDDGDGIIDEGPDSDADGDQFTWCGSGVAALADCDDNDPNVHPADPSRGIPAPTEVCDGRDNQCDGDYDAIEASGCTGAQRCSRTEARCVDPLCTYPEFQCPTDFQCVEGLCRAGSCETSGCPPTEVCDPLTRACVTPSPLGAACNTDAECESQRCFPAREALGLVSAASGATRVCGRSCCDDRDCPSDFVCWAPGTGARSCVARSVLDAGPHGAPDSSERACSDGVACEPMQCLPTTYSAFDRERLGFVCGSTTRTDRETCSTNDQCESGICLFGHGPTWLYEFGPCTGACRTIADCGRFERPFNGSIDRAFYGESTIRMGCTVARFVDTTEFVQVCLESSGGGAGATCTTDAECLDRGCLGGACRATCCNDGDCRDGEICRPFASGDRWEMHCAPALTVL